GLARPGRQSVERLGAVHPRGRPGERPGPSGRPRIDGGAGARIRVGTDIVGMVSWDAVVVGGSVAGATAARELARRGLRVALVERASFPRFKACGEGLLPHGLAALRDAGIEPE